MHKLGKITTGVLALAFLGATPLPTATAVTPVDGCGGQASDYLGPLNAPRTYTGTLNTTDGPVTFSLTLSANSQAQITADSAVLHESASGTDSAISNGPTGSVDGAVSMNASGFTLDADCSLSGVGIYLAEPAPKASSLRGRVWLDNGDAGDVDLIATT